LNTAKAIRFTLSILKKPFVFAFILLLVVTRGKSFAQHATADSVKLPKSYWATLGVGGSSLGSLTGAATANAEVWNKTMVTIGSQAEVNNLKLVGPPPGNYISLTNQNLLFGKVFKQKLTFIAASIGVGVINVVSYTDSTYFVSHNQNGFLDLSNYNTVKTHQKNQKAINIPILVQGYILVAEPVGFGFNAYLNLNKLRTTAGVTINIALGRMTTRNRKTITSEHPLPRNPPSHLPFPFLH
jgi:hypothetical protein